MTNHETIIPAKVRCRKYEYKASGFRWGGNMQGWGKEKEGQSSIKDWTIFVVLALEEVA